MPETAYITHNGAAIAYTVRRSPRRRRTISITLDGSDAVIVSAPMRTSARTIRDVVQKRAGWIARKRAEATFRPQPLEFLTGETLPYFGREIPLTAAPAGVRRVEVTLGEGGFRIGVPVALGDEDCRAAVHAAVVAWYKKQALTWIEERVAAWGERIGCAPTRVLVRDQKQRWGSCSPDGTLRFNWRLAMAAPDLTDYVVVHELLHLRVRNHGPQFWRDFTRYMPDCKERRKQLHEFGKTLRM